MLDTNIQATDNVAYRLSCGFPEKPTAAQVTTWTLQELFLAALIECNGAVYRSAALAGHSYRAFKNWLDSDIFTFQKRYEEAQAHVLENMVTEIDRRAFEGWDHPVIHQGKITDTYKAYDPQLAMFRVKKLDPSYRENHTINVEVPAIQEMLDRMREQGTPRLDAGVVEGSIVENTPEPEE